MRNEVAVLLAFIAGWLVHKGWCWIIHGAQLDAYHQAFTPMSMHSLAQTTRERNKITEAWIASEKYGWVTQMKDTAGVVHDSRCEAVRRAFGDDKSWRPGDRLTTCLCLHRAQGNKK